MRGDADLLLKLYSIFEHDFESPLRGIATGHFHLRNNETEDMLMYQSNPAGVELFPYVNTVVGFMLHNSPTEI